MSISAVASDFGTSELRSGPNPDYRPVPVLAYLEPLPRPTKAPSMLFSIENI